MNIIIVGCGKIGSSLAEQLNNEGHNLTIVDKNEARLRDIAMKLDVMGVSGNGAMIDVLHEAGLKNTDLLVAVTDSDELNMLCCLIAKKETNCQTVARIRNPEYDREIDYFKREMRINMVVNPEKLSAHEIVRLIRFPSALDIESFGLGKIDMVTVRLSEKSVLAGVQLKDLSRVCMISALVCCIERNGQIIIPNGMTELKAGDLISYLASPGEAVAFMKECAVDVKPVRLAFIIGGGRIAYYIAQYTKARRNKCALKVIERDSAKAVRFAGEFPDVTVINGDGTSQQLLEEEGIEHADMLISLTGIDEENIVTSFFASKMHTNARLITKVNHLDSKIVNSLEIGPVICPKEITSYQVTRYVRGLQGSMNSNIETYYKIAGGSAEAVEFLVNDDRRIVNIPFITLQLRPGVLVGAIIRNDEVIYPGGSDYMQQGDRVIIITSTGIRDLSDILA